MNSGMTLASLLASVDPDSKKIVTCRHCQHSCVRADCNKDQRGHLCPKCKHPMPTRYVGDGGR